MGRLRRGIDNSSRGDKKACRETGLFAFMNPDPAEDDPIPEPPVRPRPEECCGRGCEPCVYDLYEEALERYEIKLKQWEARRR